MRGSRSFQFPSDAAKRAMLKSLTDAHVSGYQRRPPVVIRAGLYPARREAQQNDYPSQTSPICKFSDA